MPNDNAAFEAGKEQCRIDHRDNIDADWHSVEADVLPLFEDWYFSKYKSSRKYHHLFKLYCNGYRDMMLNLNYNLI